MGCAGQKGLFLSENINMKNFLKKLHIMSNQSEDAEGSTSSKGNNKPNEGSSPDRILHSRPHHNFEHKPLSGLSGWLNSVANRRSPSPPSSSNETRGENMEPSDSASTGGLDVPLDAVRRDSGSSNSRDPDIEEEYQIQLALELSAKEDPEAVQIEAVKQISLGSCALDNTPAEVVAYRYWNYNSLSYDDKILDGFYDLYGVMTESAAERMPSLVDLQRTPVSDGVTWEAVLVNRVADANLLKLEQKALEMAVKSRSNSLVILGSDLVRKLAILVADSMGGPVGNPENMLRAWRSLSYNLKATLGSMVLPLGSLKVGLARHRALLFKVLADSVGFPCRLVKGQQYTGSDDVAMNFVKIDDGREYIVDLMADPGTLIPADAAGSHIDYDESFYTASPLSRDIDSSHMASSSSGVGSSFEEHSDFGIFEKRSRASNLAALGKESEDRSDFTSSANINRPTKIEEEQKVSSEDFINPSSVEKVPVREAPGRPNYPYMHARSPSWTEGVSSPAVRRMKVKDVSQYMINAAKENPQLAQKLHDVLLESGVVAPRNLFTEIYSEQLDALTAEAKSPTEDREEDKQGFGTQEIKAQEDPCPARFLPPLPPHRLHSKATNSSGQPEHFNFPLDTAEHDASGANSEGEIISDRSGGNDSTKSDGALDEVAECEIPWEEITLGERIGLGSYGEVYRGDWHGTVSFIMQTLNDHGASLVCCFGRCYVRIMKRLRHPNVVLFMGAVTRTPNLSIITEFLPRGSLYRLLHRPNNQLDERRRLRMALDAARGMNYLHNCSPMIVHRDLKSPNLLVDKNWVVKVCDFGLSRMKHSTFLSSRSTAGTAEWMAPEVLRNEPSNEKCDVYSFGVILWELSTMQQPWGGMNPMQVVGAVGFQHRRLDIPDDMDPSIADIIRKCWQTDPKLRPSFTEIMAALKPLQKPITSSQVPRQTALVGSARERPQPSQVAEDPAG
ncbi:putative serine/threonine-protein kinase sis8 [Quercus suber]|uniref:Serine/threonine-protein kinase sis8 n=1 Tax=Quercus suber TaxID=58331 RepID=A0AAW0L031_QUESU